MIMAGEPFGVRQGFIAEDVTESHAPGMIPFESREAAIPKVVPAFMPEVAEERARGLAELLAVDLTPGVIGFFEADGDDAAEMAGGGGGIEPGADDVKGEAVERIFGERGQRDLKADQGVEQSALRSLHEAPVLAVQGVAEIRDGAVEAAGDAKGLARVGGHEPVACGVALAVAAETMVFAEASDDALHGLVADINAASETA